MMSSNDMELTEFHSMRMAAKVIGVGEGVIRYARNDGRNYMRRVEGGSIQVFLIMWC